MQTYDFDVLVIGAGAVGLAIGRAAALTGRSVVVVERHAAFGTETSSRNSEVIHSGLYYPAGSMKSNMCLRGNEKLYAYCKARGIDHQRCEKLVVATTGAEQVRLLELYKNGCEVGVDGLRMLSGDEARELEPEVSCEAALQVPSTGIFDSHAFMLSLLGDLEAAGGQLVCNTEFVRAEKLPTAGFVATLIGPDSFELSAKCLVNSAGLAAINVRQNIGGTLTNDEIVPRYAKGSYFKLNRRAPFSRLVYPIPGAHGLGVHFTRDLAGAGRFGPDVEWITHPDHQVTDDRIASFVDAIRSYWKNIEPQDLSVDYAGVRPKYELDGKTGTDFRIDAFTPNGEAELINLIGIESPGLTSALEIADYLFAGALSEKQLYAASTP